MKIEWGSLLAVVGVSITAGVAVVVLVAFALVGLSTRAPQPAGGPADGAKPVPSPATGTAVAAICLVAALAIVGYGLYIIVF